jgi:ADP-ribosyl-[dinitrogen reductase] hydrolase
MRGPPIGIFYRPTRVRDVSIGCSRLTHCDSVAGECSAFVILMTSLLCRGSTRDAAFSHALHACGDPDLADLLAAYRYHPLDPSLDAAAATHCAVACFMEAETAEDAILGAVNLGGDADTIGAIAGALAGAAWGVDALPRSWLVSLQDGPALYALAIRLAAAAQR